MRNVAFGAQRVERAGDFFDDRRLDALGGFVEDQHRGSSGQRPGDGQLLLLAAREVAAACACASPVAPGRIR
jgi:hypothetical protein